LSERGPQATEQLPAGLLERLVRGTRWLVLTGAGVSAESGVPTFRDAQTGLWAKYDPLELATPDAFARDPKLVWEWYSWRRQLIGKTQPNTAHHALVELEQLKPGLTLITQNVDGLHQRAGSTRVVEFHGNIHRNKCANCERVAAEPQSDERPLCGCANCGGPLRPNVVWFGEAIPQTALEISYRAVETCEIFFSVGTSALVHPAAALAQAAMDQQAVVVEINTHPTPLSPRADYVLEGPAGRWLPLIATQIKRALS